MWNVGVVSFQTILVLSAIGVSLLGITYFLLAQMAFRRAWGEFRELQHKRVLRAAGILSPALERAKHDPFLHLSLELFPDDLKFEPLVCGSQSAHDDPLLGAVMAWEQHHHSVSRSFIDALTHVAHHRLVPVANIHEQLDPIGEAIQRLIDQCPEPVLKKELRMAYCGLRTGAEQNLQYASRRLQDKAKRSKSAFHVTIGSAHSELIRCQEDLIASICAEAECEIQVFLGQHRGFMVNPFSWGRQAAYYREFEELGERLEQAQASKDLGQVALIVMMIVEDENRFIQHIHAASKVREAIHRKLSNELQQSADLLHDETHSMTGWVSRENQRLQSSVSHQLILHLENWARDNSRHNVTEWIAELTKLRDQDPEFLAIAA